MEAALRSWLFPRRFAAAGSGGERKQTRRAPAFAERVHSSDHRRLVSSRFSRTAPPEFYSGDLIIFSIFSEIALFPQQDYMVYVVASGLPRSRGRAKVAGARTGSPGAEGSAEYRPFGM